ncbi:MULTISPECIES: LppU/SCO3897 family protein [unclassified Streptomyces]|uniref:LppU/SCO3897 family protein n=1 Tax=unclassified Streptomyces TaxID=2593676 RepID=UPI003D733B2E
MTTPTPQGQNPYAQGQPPVGQPQAPYPPNGAAPYAPVPPQPSRKISFKLIRTVVIVLAVAGAAVYGFISSRDDANTAKVGDCMHQGNSSQTNPELEVVDCTSTKAQYVVLAKIKGSYSTEIAANAKCEAEAKDFEYTYTESGGSSDFLLCLKDYKK